MAELPHFDFPFRYSNGAPVVNEQGSEKDVIACVQAVCNCEPGTLLDLLEFGLPDLTFTQEPISVRELIGPISRWEPRARAVAEVNPSALDAAIVNANIKVV